jgi:hypothetical protein
LQSAQVPIARTPWIQIPARYRRYFIRGFMSGWTISPGRNMKL